MIKCKICYGDALAIEQVLLRNKYEASLWGCRSCGFVFFNETPWLAEAYKKPIHPSDTGYVERNFRYSMLATALIRGFLNAEANFLDYGAGYGLFVRLMRDAGIDFRWQDAYTENLFARGFEWESGKEIEAATAFEVFEHLVSPVATVSELSQVTDVIVFSTDLLPNPVPKSQHWGYFGLSHGQHVAFYSVDSLKILAEKFGYQFLSDGKSLHAFHKGKLPPNALKHVNARWFRYFQRRFAASSSLIWSDHCEVEKRIQAGSLEE